MKHWFVRSERPVADGDSAADRGSGGQRRDAIVWCGIYAVLALFATYRCWLYSGWPVNHEFFAHFERVESFRRAYAAGDWFPLWTPFSNNGHGSPMPFFYHRLFNTLAALIAAPVRSSYVAVKVAIPLVTFLGGMGMDLAVAAVTPSRWMRFSATALLLGSSYALTDWLIRGSAAEFTAFMLVPWLYLYCFRVLRGDSVGGRLGVTLALLFYAHNALCYFALFIPGVTAILCLLRPPREAPLLARLAPWGRAGAAFALVAGPYLVALALTSSSFNLSALNRAWAPPANMRPLTHYVYDPSFSWGRQWRGLSVEIGLPILTALVVAAAVLVRVRATPERRLTWLLAVVVAFYVLLQTHAADWFYLQFPGAYFLGFPWRLLALMTPALILLACVLAEPLIKAVPGQRLVVLATFGLSAVWQLSLCTVRQHVKYERYTRAQIEEHLAALEIPTIGEYLPQGVGGLRRFPPRQPTVAWTSCERVSLTGDDPGAGRHIRRMNIQAESRSGCVIRLNQFASPFLQVEGASAHPSATPERTIEITVPPGSPSMTVSKRGLLGVIDSRFAAP